MPLPPSFRLRPEVIVVGVVGAIAALLLVNGARNLSMGDMTDKDQQHVSGRVALPAGPSPDGLAGRLEQEIQGVAGTSGARDATTGLPRSGQNAPGADPTADPGATAATAPLPPQAREVVTAPAAPPTATITAATTATAPATASAAAPPTATPTAATAPEAPPVACGATTCTGGMVCCNADCGICVQPGQSCNQASCSRAALPNSMPCGPNTCNVGQVCCNASCGICTAPGESCRNDACAGPTFPVVVPCGMNTCNSGQICCNPSCGTCTTPGQACSTEPCS
jgi:hypothetical protein